MLAFENESRGAAVSPALLCVKKLPRSIPEVEGWIVGVRSPVSKTCIHEKMDQTSPNLPQTISARRSHNSESDSDTEGEIAFSTPSESLPTIKLSLGKPETSKSMQIENFRPKPMAASERLPNDGEAQEPSSAQSKPKPCKGEAEQPAIFARKRPIRACSACHKSINQSEFKCLGRCNSYYCSHCVAHRGIG